MMLSKKMTTRTRSGFTVIEAMFVVLILSIASLGMLCYQYLTVKYSRIAGAELTAVRTAQLLIEDWKSTGGATDYDPTILNLGIRKSGSVYKMTVDSLPMHINLASTDVATDGASQTLLRKLDVLVEWRKDYAPGKLDTNPSSYGISTFVRVDQTTG